MSSRPKPDRSALRHSGNPDWMPSNMLDRENLPRWRANGLRYGQEEDLYQQADRAAELILSVVTD